jgi:predicted permease
MQFLLDVFVVVTLPLIVLITVGYAVQKRLPEATKALNFLHTNIVLPCFLIHFISTSTIALATTWPVIWFTILQSILTGIVCWFVARSLGFAPRVWSVVAVAGSFANTGNFGVPLALLAYPPEYTVHQAVIAATTLVMFAVLAPVLLGPADEAKTGLTAAIQRTLTNPVVLGVVAGCAMRALDLRVPLAISKPVQMLADSYPTIALLGLGAALHGSVARLTSLELQTTVLLKIVVAPLLTLGLAFALGFRGTMLTLLVVAASMPTAVLVGVIAAQNNRCPEVATASVFVSTLLAPFVVTIWIVLMQVWETGA